jgi:hypothetical protein
MYAPLRKFVVFKHLVMIGWYKLYVHIQRVQASFAHAEILGFDLTSLACTDMASEHKRLSKSHMNDMIDTLLSTIETTSLLVKIGLGVVNLDRVH